MDETPFPFLYFKTYFFYGYLQPSGSWEVIHENSFHGGMSLLHVPPPAPFGGDV